MSNLFGLLKTALKSSLNENQSAFYWFKTKVNSASLIVKCSNTSSDKKSVNNNKAATAFLLI